MIKKIGYLFLYGLTGLVAGSLTTLLLGFIWLNIFPVIERTGQGSGLTAVLTFILGVLSPISIIAGIIGGLIPREGSMKDHLLYAAIISVFTTFPFAAFLFWYTGF